MPNIHDGHRQRLRKRLEREGLDGFAPHEALELLLFYPIPLRNVNHLAHELIAAFGSLGGVLGATKQQLMAVPGVGETTADWLCALKPVVDEYLDCRLADRAQLTTFQQAADYAERIMPKAPERQLWAIGMTLSGHLLGSTQLAAGGDVERPDLRFLTQFLLRYRAQTFVLSQRRLPDAMQPGAADLSLIERIDDVLSPLRIYMMDSMFFCGHRQLSLRKLDIVKPRRTFAVLNEGGVEDEITWIE